MSGKKVTMKDIAKQLDLSINAVSIALNDKQGVAEDTRKRILDAANQMGYLDQSPKYIQTYSNKNICVLLDNRFFRDFRFYGRILLGIEEESKKFDYDVFINSFTSEEVPACVSSRKVSGIIIVGKITDSFLHVLRGYGLPIVLADYFSLKEPVDCVMSDNKLGAFRMASYLFEKGYKKIGYFGDLAYSPSTRERFYGYQEAVQLHLGMNDISAALQYARNYSVLSDVEALVIKRDHNGIFEYFNGIKEKPDVIMCSNDELAIQLLKALQSNGYSVPEDIAVCGFDDIEPAKIVTPALTTVHVSRKLMGQNATRRILRKIANPKDQVEKLVMSVEVVERASTK